LSQADESLGGIAGVAPAQPAAELARMPTMKRLVFSSTFLCLVALFGCAPPPKPQADIRFAFPTLTLDGAYASQLTFAEVRQIRDLVRDRADLRKPIDHITIDKPDEAHVTSGAPRKNGDLSSSFDIRRKVGRWFIVEKTIQTARNLR